MKDDLSRADIKDLSQARRGTVYILQCANGQYYVGSTNDISERLREHQVEDGALFKGAKFTKAHLPVKLVYTEE